MTNAIDYMAPVDEVSDQDAFDVFDSIVRHEMNLTGEAFLECYDHGGYDVDPDSVRGLAAVLSVLPFAR